MRRVLANALVLAGLLVPWCAYAQRRGAPHFTFSGSARSYRSYAAAPRPHLPPRPARPLAHAYNTYSRNWAFPPVTGSSLINPGEASCLLNPSFAGSFYCRQYFSGRPAWAFEPVYPFWWPSPGSETEETAQPAPEVTQDSQLAAQVGNLAAEVEMMREDEAQRDARGAPSAEPYVGMEEKPPTTVLVYRDGRQIEVEDYAISGQTLWVFSNQLTRRVPLADLDLAATERVNEERGVEFVSPSTH